MTTWFKDTLSKNQLVMVKRLGDLLHATVKGLLFECGVVHSHIAESVSVMIVRALLGDSLVNCDEQWEHLFPLVQSSLGLIDFFVCFC